MSAAAVGLAFAFGAPAAAALEVRSDVRVDLVGLLQLMAQGNGVARSDYLKGVLKRFEPFKSHAAVRRLAEMGKSGFRGDIPGNYAVYLSAPPDIREAFPVPEFFTDNAGGRPQLSAFLLEMNGFVLDSGFMEWHASQREEIALVENSLRETLAGADLEGPLVRYLGLRSWDRWIVVPSPFFPEADGSSWVLEEKPGLPDVYVIYGPSWVKGRAVFGPVPRIAHGVWPEAIYSTLYVMVELCRPQLRLVRDVCESRWKFKDAEMESCVEKRWMDAIRRRLQEQVFGEGGHAGPPQSKLDRAVASALIEYEGQRERYPDMISRTADLLAPLQSDGLPANCRLIDESRFQETLYARRLEWYLEMRLSARPDSDLMKVRTLLSRAQAH